MTPPVETRPPAQGPTHRTRQRVRTGQTILAAALLVAVVGLLATAVLDEPARVDQVRVDNPSEYDINVDVRPVDSPGRLLLGRAVQECTTPFHLVVDQGPTWVVRFSAQGVDGGEVTLDRAQLERDGWTIRVPQTVIDGLRESGAPAPPNQRCATG
jgi:hypothetical protein